MAEVKHGVIGKNIRNFVLSQKVYYIIYYF